MGILHQGLVRELKLACTHVDNQDRGLVCSFFVMSRDKGMYYSYLMFEGCGVKRNATWIL